MRIIFLCSSLECGRDGVGDYTRLLAQKLLTFGHEIKVIALNDRHIAAQSIEKHDQSLSIIRFGSQVCWKRRTDIAREQLEKFCPDWVSLQYVSFGFHQKGIPFFLPRRLRKLGMVHKWHVMFHELWNGGNLHSKLSHRLLGLFEKHISFSLVKKLKPRLCTTSNALYHQWLNDAKIANETLPLFSNIRSQTNEQNFKSISENTVAIFGHLESEELGRELISAAIKMADSRPLKWRVFGLAGSKWEKVLREKGISFHSSGQMGEEELSMAFQSCRFGLASTNIYRIGKSGSALAMLENGLPLLVGSSGWVPRNYSRHPETPSGCVACQSNPSWAELPKNGQFKKPPSPKEIAQRVVSLLDAS